MSKENKKKVSESKEDEDYEIGLILGILLVIFVFVLFILFIITLPYTVNY